MFNSQAATPTQVAPVAGGQSPTLTKPHEGKIPAGSWYTFHVLFILIEAAIVFLYGFCLQYTQEFTDITQQLNRPLITDDGTGFFVLWPYHQDILVMCLVGLTFITAYMKYNNLSNASIGFVCAALAIQTYILFRALWNAAWTEYWGWYDMDFTSFITALYCVVAVLITWAALIGRAGPSQMLIITIIESFLFSLNERICFHDIIGYDLGGSMTVYAFGGLFALGAGLVYYRGAAKNEVQERRNNAHDGYASTFALIGTLFLWVFWPSLNAGRITGFIGYGLPLGNQLERAVINTVFSLTGSVIATFVWSALFNQNAFDVEHIIKGTIAGGVMIGAASDLCMHPFAAILVGVFAGSVTVWFFTCCQKRTKHFDTFGVTWLFTLNGVLGGFWSAIFVGALSNSVVGFDLSTVYPTGRSPNAQGGSQLAILGISCIIGLFGGIASGILTRFCPCFAPEDSDLFAQDAQLTHPESDLVQQAGLAKPSNRA